MEVLGFSPQYPCYRLFYVLAVRIEHLLLGLVLGGLPNGKKIQAMMSNNSILPLIEELSRSPGRVR